MTAAEPGRQRRRSTLADEAPWKVPAKPETQQPTAPGQPPADSPTGTPVAPPRRRARDMIEARGRKLARDSAYGWAAAEARAAERRQELLDQLAAAKARGTTPETLYGFLTEACARYGIDIQSLSPELLAAIGRTP